MMSPMLRCRWQVTALGCLAGLFLFPPLALVGQSLAHDMEILAVDRDRMALPVTVDIPLTMGGMRRERDRWMARIRCQADIERAVQVVMSEGEDGERTGTLHWIEPFLPAGQSKRLEVFLQPGPRRTLRGLPQFQFVEGDGYRDLRYGEQGVMRFMIVHDPDNLPDTHKPFQQIFAIHGQGFLTKGAGGLFPHHKGIFLGWNRTMIAGKRQDFWHARNEHQQHRGFVEEGEFTGPLVARTTAVTDWVSQEGETVVRDKRQVTAWRLSEREWMFDYDITIESLAGEIELGGDAHHAGFQIRAAQEVADRKDETVYLRPDNAVGTGNDIHADLSWMALRMPLGERTYTLAHLDHPQNPRPTVYSGRDYGRFGAFFTASISEERPLRLLYRIHVADTTGSGEPAPAFWADRQADFAEGTEVVVRSRMVY